MSELFYNRFPSEEITQFEIYLERILESLYTYSLKNK